LHRRQFPLDADLVNMLPGQQQLQLLVAAVAVAVAVATYAACVAALARVKLTIY